jgi:hypothetical protein
MNLNLKAPTNTTLKMRRQDVHSATNARPGTTIVCEEGILWLTQSNDLNDYLLEQGQKLVVEKKSNLTIEALSNARMRIVSSN